MRGGGLLQGKGWAAEWQVVWASLSETPGAPRAVLTSGLVKTTHQAAALRTTGSAQCGTQHRPDTRSGLQGSRREARPGGAGLLCS